MNGTHPGVRSKPSSVYGDLPNMVYLPRHGAMKQWLIDIADPSTLNLSDQLNRTLTVREGHQNHRTKRTPN